MDNTLYPSPFVMAFTEISVPAWFAILKNGGSIRPSMWGTSPVWEITFPEGTVFDGPTMEFQFKSMDYTLPDGHSVWSGSDRFHYNNCQGNVWGSKQKVDNWLSGETRSYHEQ